MYQASKRFLYWVVYFPLAINVLLFLMQLILHTIIWLYLKPDSTTSPVQSIFFGRGITFDEFLQLRLFALLSVVTVGLGIWLWEYYSFRKAMKNEALNSDKSAVSENKTKRSLLGWILFVAVGYNLLHYIALVMVKFNDWLFIDPYFIDKPAAQYIFLPGYESVAELLKYKLYGAVFWSMVGILGWVIQQYTSRNDAP